MRRIGTHAHPLTVVNYFSWALVLVAAVLVIIAQMSWPTSLETWSYMTIVGAFGGLMVRVSARGSHLRIQLHLPPPNTDTSRRNSY